MTSHAVGRPRAVPGVALVLALLVALGCGRPAGAELSADERAVFQIATMGGMVAYSGPNIPNLTLWDSGRVVFWRDADRVVREARIGEDAVRRILAAAEALYELDTRVPLCACTDVPTTYIAVDGPRGPKTVESYGFGPEPWSGETDSAHAEKLRGVYRAAWAEVPMTAPTMQPTDVLVTAYENIPSTAVDRSTRLESWPSDLVGHLTGQRAQDALARRGLDGRAPGLFLHDGKQSEISVAPFMPLLYLPAGLGYFAVPPRHPSIVAVNVEGNPFLYHGVSQSDVAAWYRETMPAAGWRVARDDQDSLQVWTSVDGPPTVLKLLFATDHLTMESVPVYGGLLPLPEPFGGAGGAGCPQEAIATCISTSTMAPDALEGWTRENLGYLGWTEQPPDSFWRERPSIPVYPPPGIELPSSLAPRIEHEGFRLEVRATDTGAVAIAHRDLAVAPSDGWTPSRDGDRWQLCDATRGSVVTVGEQEIQLHEAICVTLDEPDRLRLQVAYGSSYLDLNPSTGQYLGMASGSDGGLNRFLPDLFPMPRPTGPIPMPPRLVPGLPSLVPATGRAP